MEVLSCSRQEVDGEQHLRVNFFVPGQARRWHMHLHVLRSLPQPSASIVLGARPHVTESISDLATHCTCLRSSFYCHIVINSSHAKLVDFEDWAIAPQFVALVPCSYPRRGVHLLVLSMPCRMSWTREAHGHAEGPPKAVLQVPCLLRHRVGAHKRASNTLLYEIKG